ncbi:GNAT family protein [Allomuricauda sp. d1]|uniref:GNAT family N-acetyltransferase n=1 Tax=Allomuricauda sp. d1 TaxID=3136725 RepID=UPI0031E10988
MLTLKGDNITLRALEKQDLDFLYLLENDTSIWEVSGTLTPYSKGLLKRYLENAHLDIYEAKQLRLVICNEKDKAIGLIDLFDFNPKHKRAGVGIIIADGQDRNKGVGGEALQLLCDYAFKVLDLHQLYANILVANEASIHLFEKMCFEKVGVKKDWIRSEGAFKDEILYQKIREHVS